MGAARPSPPPSFGGGGQQDKTQSHSRGPKNGWETKGKQTGLEPGARCRVCPPPPPRTDDGWLQPQFARRAGPAIYITLAFHRSPLTRHCLGPRPSGPRGSSSSHWRTGTVCEGAARLEEGRDTACSGLRVQGLLPASVPWREEEARGRVAASQERQDWTSGLSSPYGSCQAASRASRERGSSQRG